MTYKIYRSYAPGHKPEKYIGTHHLIKSDLTLEEAQEHCSDPKTRKAGVWFDYYVKDED